MEYIDAIINRIIPYLIPHYSLIYDWLENHLASVTCDNAREIEDEHFALDYMHRLMMRQNVGMPVNGICIN